MPSPQSFSFCTAGLAAFLSLFLLLVSACSDHGTQPASSSTPRDVPLATRTARPRPARTNIAPSPSPTMTDVEKEYYEWLANRPRDMESYGFIYDPRATPQFPSQNPIGFPIWGRSMPLVAFDGEPVFIEYAPPALGVDTEAILAEAGCPQIEVWEIECLDSSPVLDFGCERLFQLRRYHLGSGLDGDVLAMCVLPENEEDQLQEDGLFRIGCAFRRDAAFIFHQGGEYSLIQTRAELKALMLPIDSPQKALDYLQMMTGLSARYIFEAKPELLYFQDPIEGTRVTQNDGVYTINLFHNQGCFCEPWVDSEIYLEVDIEGEISFVGGLPITMTIGMSCAD